MHLTFAPPYEHSGGNTVDVTNNSNANSPDALIKRCPGCGETKPHSEFSKNKAQRDGLQTHCKQCVAVYHARYRSKNIDALRERDVRCYRENADKIHERKARYHSENADKIHESNARYHRENPDKARATAHRRRATKRALPSQWSDTDIQRMFAYWKNRCAICNQHVEPNNAFYFLAADHWIALTSPECPGTVHWNMLPLCHSKIGSALGCNNSKHDADPIEWLNRRYPDDPKLVTKILARIAKYFKFIVTDGAQ